MQKANEPVEREVILGRHHDPCIMQAFKGALTVKFRGMEHHERCVFIRADSAWKQPRRTALAGRHVFRGLRPCSLHENQPVGENETEPISSCAAGWMKPNHRSVATFDASRVRSVLALRRHQPAQNIRRRSGRSCGGLGYERVSSYRSDPHMILSCFLLLPRTSVWGPGGDLMMGRCMKFDTL